MFPVLFRRKKRKAKPGPRRKELRDIDIELRKEILRLKAKKAGKKRMVDIDLLISRRAKRKRKYI